MAPSLPELPLEILLIIISFIPPDNYDPISPFEPPTSPTIARYQLTRVCRRLYFLLNPAKLTAKETAYLRLWRLHQTGGSAINSVCFICARIRAQWHILYEGKCRHTAFFHCVYCHPPPDQLTSFPHNCYEPTHGQGAGHGQGQAAAAAGTSNACHLTRPLWCGTGLEWCDFCKEWELNMSGYAPGISGEIKIFFNCRERIAYVPPPVDTDVPGFWREPPMFKLKEFGAMMDFYWDLVWPEARSWFLMRRWPKKTVRSRMNEAWYEKLLELVELLRRLKYSPIKEMHKMWIGKKAMKRRAEALERNDIHEARRTARLKQVMEECKMAKQQDPIWLWGSESHQAAKKEDRAVIDKLVELFEDTKMLGAMGGL